MKKASIIALVLAAVAAIGIFAVPNVTQPLHAQSYATCISKAASPACGATSAGIAVIAASAQTVVINTTAVTATTPILITADDSVALGTALGSTTCNTTVQTLYVDARVAGVSFTVKSGTGTFTTNPGCFSWHIINQ